MALRALAIVAKLHVTAMQAAGLMGASQSGTEQAAIGYRDAVCAIVGESEGPRLFLPVCALAEFFRLTHRRPACCRPDGGGAAAGSGQRPSQRHRWWQRGGAGHLAELGNHPDDVSAPMFPFEPLSQSPPQDCAVRIYTPPSKEMRSSQRRPAPSAPKATLARVKLRMPACTCVAPR